MSGSTDKQTWWSATKRYVGRHRTLATTTAVVVVGLVVLSTRWSATAATRGQLVARYAVAHGHYEVLGYGLPVPWQPEYARLLHERYGIEFSGVAGCLVSESLLSYVDAYNNVSMEAAKRKFGHDVFKECEDDAHADWERAAAEAKKK